VEHSAAVVVISVAGHSLLSALAGGRALQRVWLTATSLKVAAQPVSAPIFMGLHHLWDTSHILSAAEHRSAKSLYDGLAALVELKSHQPLFLLRLATAEDVTVRSLRRPVADVLTSRNTTIAWKD